MCTCVFSQQKTSHNTFTINCSLAIKVTCAEPGCISCKAHPTAWRTMFQEITSFILSSSGRVLVSSTLPTNCWKVSSLDGTVITTNTYWSNLWNICVTDSTGVSDCKDFPSMLALDGWNDSMGLLCVVDCAVNCWIFPLFRKWLCAFF